MKFNNLHIFNIYKIFLKLLLLFICCFVCGCSGTKQTPRLLTTENTTSRSERVININQASAEELGKLPHIGAKLAQDIVDYRFRFGSFRKTEHLLLIDGISDKKYREIKSLIKAE